MDKTSKRIIAAFAALIVIAGLFLTIKPAKNTAFDNIQNSTAKAINKNSLKLRKDSHTTTDATKLEILRVDVWNYSPFASYEPSDYHWVFVIQKDSFKRVGNKIFYRDVKGNAQLINTNGMKDLEVTVSPVLETDDTYKYLGIHTLG